MNYKNRKKNKKVVCLYFSNTSFILLEFLWNKVYIPQVYFWVWKEIHYLGNLLQVYFPGFGNKYKRLKSLL